jgi:murein L,D-transpeptidase YcbB/YkuD
VLTSWNRALPNRALAMLYLGVVACIAGCDRTSAGQAADNVGRGQSAGPRTNRVVDSVQLAAALANALSAKRPPQLRADEWKTVARLYHPTSSSAAPAPLWLDRGRLAARAMELLAVVDSARALGLRPADYAVGQLTAALRAATASADGEADAQPLARADVILTASFVAMVDDLLTGRLDPRRVEPSWHIAPRVFDVSGRIEAALDSARAGRRLTDVLARLRPDYGSYGALLGALARYRGLDQRGEWERLAAGPTLRRGDAGNRVSEVRRRLAAEDFLSSATGADTFDVAIAGAIAEFQRRHGLAIDSALGPATRTALNIPASRRVTQIEANLERLRWLPPDPGQRFIVVNVPAFILYAFEGRERTITMRVVVGDELASRRTPIFADTMEYIQFGPYWNVPRSIAVNEILPQAKRDRGYLSRNNYEILRGWGDNAPVVDPRTLSSAELSSARYRVRQKPGPNNALGRVKFMFPNDYAVYLHDTPARARFEDTDRAASHGCVRVADPKALAEYVLNDRADWPPDRISATLSAGRRVRVNLKHGPPVYLVYLTAFGRDSQVLFRDDIYDRDERLVKALAAAARDARPGS